MLNLKFNSAISVFSKHESPQDSILSISCYHEEVCYLSSILPSKKDDNYIPLRHEFWNPSNVAWHIPGYILEPYSENGKKS